MTSSHNATNQAGIDHALIERGGAALRRCTALSAAEFAERHWGRRPLLTRAAELDADFTDLLDTAAVDELVSRRGLRTPFLRMAKQGEVLPAKAYTRGGGAGAGIADQAADDRVLAELAGGATLVLQALHRTWPPLVDFGSRLAADLGHPVQINSYVTPPQNRGFAAHYDVHDVFVLQVSGRKSWKIYEPVVPDPLERQNWERSREQVAAGADGEPLLDVVLEPGDSLYLPRGTIHAAEALGETSIHLTVGVHPITRYDLLRALLDLAQDAPALRSSLPMGRDLGDPAVLGPHLDATVDALRAFADGLGADAVAERVAGKLADQTRPEPVGPLAQLSAADGLHPDTMLRLRSALRWTLAGSDDTLTLKLIDRTVTFPGECGAALKVVLDGGPFTPAQLPDLDAGSQLTLARRLLREAVIVVA